MKKGYWYVLCVLIVLIDQASKYWVTMTFIPYKPIPIIPFLNLTPAINTGAAFSFLSTSGPWHRWFFAGFSLIVSMIITVWLWRTPKDDALQSIGLSLILGGAVGNLIDRAFQGYVIDFIDVYYKTHHFATFNIADSAICVGAVLLVLDLMIHKK